MMRTDTLVPRIRSLQRSVGMSQLRTAIMTGIYALYFPALLGLLIGGPVVLAQLTTLSLLQAAHVSLGLGAIGYLFGLVVLFK